MSVDAQRQHDETPGSPANSRPLRGTAALMIVEAVSLAVASSLHLAGAVAGRTTSFNPDAAGIAEAAIGSVLLIAALVILRVPSRARPTALGANLFALVGFIIGISETATAGHAPDIAYHASVIALLIATLVAVWRHGVSPSVGTAPARSRRRSRGPFTGSAAGS